MRIRIALLALVAGTLAMTSPASGEGWFREIDKAREVTLGDLLRNPRSYVNVDVKFKLYYNAPGGAYNPYFTRFTEEMYGNFSAWPIDARLYEKRDYQRSYHFFFIKRVNPAWKKIQRVKTMTAVEVHATVREVFRGQAWIEVFDFDTVSEGLTPEQVRNVVAGDAYYYAGRHSEAARHYSRAVSSRQSDAVQADIYRRLADARFGDGDYRGALSSYRDALDNEPDSTVLQRGVAAAQAAVARSKGKGGEDLLPAPRQEPVTSKPTSVDAIINLLEDPASVEAEVEAWRLELEKRSAHVRGEAGVEPVAGTEPAPEVAPQPETAPADGCSPAIVEEEAGAVEAPEIVVPESGDEAGCGEADEAAPGTHGRDPFVTEPPADETGNEAVDTGDATDETDATETTDEGMDTADEAGSDEGVDTDAGDACGASDTTEVDEGMDTATDAADATATDEETAGCETAEGMESAEGCAPSSADGCADTAEGCGDDTAEGMSDESSEGCASDDESAWWEDTTDETMEGCGEEVVEAGDETTNGDPHIVQVAGVVVRLTRLPFFGCEEVTLEDWRAVVEEIVTNPEN